MAGGKCWRHFSDPAGEFAMLPGRRCPLPTRKGAPYILRFYTPLACLFRGPRNVNFEVIRITILLSTSSPSCRGSGSLGSVDQPPLVRGRGLRCPVWCNPTFISLHGCNHAAVFVRVSAACCPAMRWSPFCCRPLNRTVSVQSQSFARRPLYPQAAYRLVARSLGIGNRSLYVRFLAARLVKPVYFDTCHVSRSPAQI